MRTDAQNKAAEVRQLKGVILAAEESQLKFGQFTELANWVPTGFAHLKKKRGVSILSSSVVSPEAPTPCDGMSGGGSAGDLTTTDASDPNA